MKPDAEQPFIRILLVEDDEDDFVLTRDALRTISKGRMVLEWVDNGAQALAELKTGRHDVCLLDYRLDASTGLELLAKMRQQGWLGPVILLTGMSDEALDEQALKAGAADFLDKSQLSPTLLARSIRYALQNARTLEALRRSQASFRALIERLPDGIGVTQDERLVYANPALVSLIGMSSADELLGGSRAELEGLFIHAESRAMLPRDDQAGMEAKGSPPPMEIRMVRKNGTPVFVELAHAPSVFDGHPCIVWLVRDLTDRRQMEARLVRADRMASLGTLAAGIAHEINNPLAFTVANLSHLESDMLPRLKLPTGEQEEMRKLVSDAQLGATRVRDIVRQLKMFSRADEQARPEPVEVNRVLESAISMASNEIKHRARLVRDFTDQLVAVAHEGRLGQVMVNLLVNAAQAIPEGNAELNEIRVLTRTHAEGLAIEVRDTGSGISKENLERLFEPFFTTKPVGVGTGLGLPICQDIVTSFGGRMEVESEVGKGSTFRVILRAANVVRPSQAPKEAVAPVASRRGRILVVDDEPMIGMAIRRTLQREHEVIALTSAREAQARLTSGERFDLILCDLMMPEMTGMELHQAVASHSPGLAGRMVFLTGGAFTANARDFLNQVPNHRVEKPFSTQELRGLVQSLLAAAS
ncbi:hybrid sensor histidine kinase/response regulator [Archangium sp. Cb G35]|uniref:response regulator n=1 Tax=Archangium sp. Cb G35 TaxID=1920190 RepID=UPI0009361EC1|nr:response regulator [Archangium sp. Cb G35]OJT16883.1 hybrid sensor histidine kinase/response regulator [Archangium sp. Cb G35]